jgi:hypothetical protein
LRGICVNCILFFFQTEGEAFKEKLSYKLQVVWYAEDQTWISDAIEAIDNHRYYTIEDHCEQVSNKGAKREIYYVKHNESYVEL